MRKGTVELAIVTMTVVLASLATASVSPAATFVWKGGSGFWYDKTKWTQTAGGPSAGFPNNSGDIAEFTLPYTGDQTVTLPNGEITVGAIRVNSARVFIKPDGPHSRLVMDNGSFPAELFKYDGTLVNSLEIEVPMRLRTNLILDVAQNASIQVGFIGQSYESRNVTKRGRGRVVFSTPTNGYTGLTTVEDGELNLASGFGNAIQGDLTIGDGIGAGNSARLTTFGGDQIEDHATVRVRPDGRYEPSSPDRIGRLIASGTVSLQFGRLTTDAMILDGALIEIGDELALPDTVTVVANPAGPTVIRQSANAKGLTLGTAPRTIVVEDGPGVVDLEIAAKISGTDAAALIKDGAGTLRLASPASNTYPGATRVLRGRLEVARVRAGVTSIPGRLDIGGGSGPAAAVFLAGDAAAYGSSIAAGVDIIVGSNGSVNSETPETPRSLFVDEGGRLTLDGAAVWTLNALAMTGGQLALNNGTLRLAGDAALTSGARESASIAGDAASGGLVFVGAGRSLVVGDGPQAIDLRLAARTVGMAKRGAGALAFQPPAGGDALAVAEGAMIVSGTCASCAFTLTGGVLGGSGTIGKVTSTGGVIAPGTSPGRLVTQALSLAAGTTFAVEIQGTTAGSGYDQVDVRGTVSLGQATLQLTGAAAVLPTTGAALTIVANDDSDPIAGTFAGLPEGATIALGARALTISYRGGDGNDVVLTAADTTPFTYFLAEGATGAFFDDDVLIANPNDAEAPITLTFLQEGGAKVVEHRTLAAQSRLTLHVDQIPGLESSSASVQVVSEDRQPLVVERSMFWDASYYGGHTANAVDKPETRWIFAEGSQGFFDTYVLIANANDQPTTATLTFLREGQAPVVTTVAIDAFARKTVYAGDYADLIGQSFGIVVDAAAPVIAERAMYFATLPDKLWSGGHANTGIPAPSTSWFHAEGATGGFFTTFILLSNPQDTAAHVALRFLLDNGEVITRTKTIEPRQRLTINPAAEGDARLEDAALSTEVRADVPIVSERSMYWAGDAQPFGEGHNSSGVIDTATRWGLAEGRLGGEHAFDTFILLANPSPRPAQVTITYLREHDAPIVRTYDVPATSRFNVDVKESVPELRESSFGARIDVANGVPIVVERSLYWNANGSFWAGGTNALATRLP